MFRFVTLALKNIFRQKKRSFTLGVNYAMVSFILVLLFAFSRGAAVNISSNLVRSSAGHITISGQFASDGKIYNGILRTGDIEEAIGRTLPVGTTVLKRYQVQSSVYYKGISKRLPFVGIEAGRDTGFRDQIRFVEGSWDEYAADNNGVVIPRDTAKYFELGNGDEIVLSSRTRFGAFNTGILVVRGIYESDNFFIGGTVLAHFDFIRNLDLATQDASTMLYVYLPQASGYGEARERLSEILASRGFEITRPRNDAEAISVVSSASTTYEEDAQGRDRVILKLATLDEVLGIVRSVLGAVNAVGGFIAAVMLFVIAVSIFINLRMNINERLREIGTMRAVGMEAGGVTGLFMLESVLLALLFSGIGSLLGVATSLAVRYGLTLPSGGNLGIFLNAGKLVLIPDASGVLSVMLVITLFAGLFSYFPARRGGRISPVTALTKTF